jgi:hypothetical protein
MSKQSIDLDIVCKSCGGTGLYAGVAERDGSAVVCHTCIGSGKQAWHFEYEPFEQRRPAPEAITRVHLARGYVLSETHPGCDGGVPVSEYEPGMVVPADEKLYCPYLYTSQDWCARPEVPDWGGEPRPPVLAGQYISSCKHWDDKATCWRLFHAEASSDAKEQVS